MARQTLDDELLQAYMTTFYGYGSYAGRFWFIGMEEGGGNSVGEIARRLAAWRDRGGHELEDLPGYHREIGISRWFDDPVKLQATWSKLIRIRLSAEGRDVSTGAVRACQQGAWGRWGGDSCLLELLPLPSPSRRCWLYGRHSRLPFLASREVYVSRYVSQRAAHIRRRIREHAPEVVVFYGIGFLGWWRAIASVSLELIRSEGVYLGATPQTLFIAAKHPSARGVSNSYYQRIGQTVRHGLRAAPSPSA